MKISAWQKVCTLLKVESGSAAVEFVCLAIPLFLPIFIYLTHFSEVSNKELGARSLVREIVRAYVASENVDSARARAQMVMQVGAQRLGFSQGEISTMGLTFTCSDPRCLVPGERVRAELTLQLPISHRQVRTSAQEYVSPWQ